MSGSVRQTLLIFALAAAGCGPIPRDPDRTTELIRENGSIRLGTVAGEARDPASERQLAAVAREMGVAIRRVEGPAERLLSELERGELDLVYGTFAADSPWSSAVHFGTPPSWRTTPPKNHAAPRFAYRLGENGWIMRVEKAGS